MKLIKEKLFPSFLFLIIYLIHKTLRYKIKGLENLQGDKKGSLLLASWHENSLLGVTSMSVVGKFSLLASPSSDGELIAKVAHRFGLGSIRGSSSRGGVKAVLSLQRILAKGAKVAFAVDGPKGPPRVVKPGILFLSKKKRVPIVPMCCKSHSYWVLSKTWDQFRVPKPFSTVTVNFGSPLLFDESIPEASCLLKEQLDLMEASS